MRHPSVAKKVLFGCLGLLLGSSLIGTAQAACRQADLTGTWHAVGISGNIVGSYFDITNRCKVRISSSGAIVASASSCTYRDWTGLGTSNITGGKLTVNPSCAVTGSINICEPNGCIAMRVQFAQIDRSKSTMDYLGYSDSDRGFRYVFRFVKQ